MSQILDKIKTHSTIVEGGRNTFEKLKREIADEKVDNFILESHDDKLGADEFRSLSSFFNLKYSQRKMIVIYVAGVSDIVQNMMLKTLEDGNENVQMVVIIPNTSILLPTVISRVQILKDLVSEDFDIRNLPSMKEMIEWNRQDLYFLANSFLPKMTKVGKFKEIERLLEIMQIFIDGDINKKQFLQYVFSVIPMV
jgi:hypothetical protein